MLPHDITAIVHRKARSPRRFLFKGGIYSFVFHMIVLVLFQIRADHPPLTRTRPSPQITIELSTPPLTILDLVSPEEYASSESQLSCSSIAPLPNYNIVRGTCAPQTLHLPQVLPWPATRPSLQRRAYPLKLSIRDQLRTVPLLNDGSSLFQEADYRALFITQYFTSCHPKVEFMVQVSAQSGEIISWTCSKEFVDKRMQHLAIKLLSLLQFQPSQTEGTISGHISIQFFGTFDTIRPLIYWGMPL